MEDAIVMLKHYHDLKDICAKPGSDT
jgi:hypothetical protein